MKKLRAPRHLRGSARDLWGKMLDQFEISDAAGLALLQAACESLQRADAARRIVDAEGLMARDRFGVSREHPALKTERDARGALLAALRALRLEPGE